MPACEGIFGGYLGLDLQAIIPDVQFFKSLGDAGYTPQFGWTEDDVNCPVPFPIRFRNLSIRTSTAQPVTSALVVALRKNGVRTNLAIRIPAGAAAGRFTSSGYADVGIGDMACWEMTSEPAESASAVVVGFTCVAEKL